MDAKIWYSNGLQYASDMELGLLRAIVVVPAEREHMKVDRDLLDVFLGADAPDCTRHGNGA